MRRPLTTQESLAALHLAERLEKEDGKERRVAITVDNMQIHIWPTEGDEPFIISLNKWVIRQGWFKKITTFNLEVIYRLAGTSLKISIDDITELQDYPQPNWWTAGEQGESKK
jgi:hypothetical protein